MRIVTFMSADGPDGQQAIARVWCILPGFQNTPTWTWHPVVFHAASEEAAKERAQTWWDTQVAKEKARTAHYERLRTISKEKAKITKQIVKVTVPVKETVSTPSPSLSKPAPSLNKPAPSLGLSLKKPVPSFGKLPS